MADKPHFPKITASTVEEFAAIEKKLKNLPQKILDQIEVVNNHFFITCQLRELFDLSKYVVLPSYTRQIKSSYDKDTGLLDIVIYADEFLFKINWKHRGDNAFINYEFIDCKPKEEKNGNV